MKDILLQGHVNLIANIPLLCAIVQYMKQIDQFDEIILRELERDGRISNVDLAEKVGLSTSACLRRVQDLEKNGTIKGYRAVINGEHIGKGFAVIVTVGLARHLKKDQQEFERAMQAAPQVKECHSISGEFEYMLRIEVRDLAAYKYFHTEILGTVPQVARITSHFVMASPKDMRG